MNLYLYEPVIRVQTKSVFGNRDETFRYDAPQLKPIPVIQAWLADNELQEITVCSSNIGFIKTFRKFYIGKLPEPEGK